MSKNKLSSSDKKVLNSVFPANAKFDRARAKANAELIHIIAQYLADNPNQRFGQALQNLDIVTAKEVTINDGKGIEYLETIWRNSYMVEPQVMVAYAKEALGRFRAKK